MKYTTILLPLVLALSLPALAQTSQITVHWTGLQSLAPSRVIPVSYVGTKGMLSGMAHLLSGAPSLEYNITWNGNTPMKSGNSLFTSNYNGVYYTLDIEDMGNGCARLVLSWEARNTGNAQQGNKGLSEVGFVYKDKQGKLFDAHGNEVDSNGRVKNPSTSTKMTMDRSSLSMRSNLIYGVGQTFKFSYYYFSSQNSYYAVSSSSYSSSIPKGSVKIGEATVIGYEDDLVFSLTTPWNSIGDCPIDSSMRDIDGLPFGMENPYIPTIYTPPPVEPRQVIILNDRMR
jgi:hypothetical protein